MILLSNRTTWEAAAGATLIAGVTLGAFFFLRRKKPSEEELERVRRKALAQSGRLIDGMLLDIREMTTEDGRPLTMLIEAPASITSARRMSLPSLPWSTPNRCAPGSPARFGTNPETRRTALCLPSPGPASAPASPSTPPPPNAPASATSAPTAASVPSSLARSFSRPLSACPLVPLFPRHPRSLVPCLSI